MKSVFRTLLLKFFTIFLCSQILGLYTGIQYVEFFRENPEIQAFDEPENVSNSLFLFTYVLAGAGIFLIIIKYYSGDLLFKLLEGMVVFFSSMIVFDVFIPLIYGIPFSLFAALGLVYLKFTRKGILIQNVASVLAVSGAGALLGSSLGVIPVLVFIILLSTYDLVAVFYTKHMVTMAKAIVKRRLAFTVAMPTRVHTFQLGTGDLFVPLMLSVSAYGALGLIQAISVIAGAFFGFFILFLHASRKPGKPLPALPPVCAFSAGFLALSVAGQII